MGSSDESPSSDDVQYDLVAERHTLVLIALTAVGTACFIFGVMRWLVTWQTGLRTPWWGNAAGLVAIVGLYLWYRRSPAARSARTAHAIALVATVALLIPVAYGMTSSIWWLSLVGFAMVLLGRATEAKLWGAGIPLLVVVALLLAPHTRVVGAAGERLVEAALAKMAFVCVLIGMSLAFRRAAEKRARELRDSEEEVRRLKNQFEARALSGEDLAERRWQQLEHLNAVLRAIRGVSQLITRETEPTRLAQQIAATLITTRGYLGAWIGLLGPDGSLSSWGDPTCKGTLVPFARRLLQGRLRPGDGTDERVDTGTATEPGGPGQPCVVLEDHGDRMAAIVALRHGARTHGILGVSYARDIVMDDEEKGLLAEVADDIAYALSGIETQAEQERIAAAQRESEARFRALFEEVPVGVLLVDERGTAVAANKAWFGMVGGTPERFVGKDAFDEAAASGMDAAKLRADLERRLAGYAGLGELTFPRPDGTLATVSVRAAQFPATGPAKQLLYLFDDITERKRAEEERRAAHAGLQRILDNLQDAYFQADLSGRFTVVSPSAARLFGYDSAAAMIGLPAADHYAEPNVRDDVIRMVRERGSLSDQIGQARRKDGSVFWVSMNVQLLRDEHGTVIGTEGMVRDITERCLAEEALRESQSDYRTLFENMVQGVFFQNRDGTVADANPAALELFGLGRDELLCRTSLDPQWKVIQEDGSALPGERHPSMVALRTHRTVRDAVAGVFNPRTNAYVWLSINAIPQFRLGESAPYRVFVTLHDITERRRAEEERRQLQANLAQSDRLTSMGLLAAGVAHEINNPLSYVIYNLESLCEELPRRLRQLSNLREALRLRLGDDGVHETLGAQPDVLTPGKWADVLDRFRDALGGSTRIKEIARGLSTFSRFDSDELAPVYLPYPIESALSIANNEIKYRATVDKDLAAVAPVLGNESKLSQVFLNLFINAAHAIPEGDVEKNRICVRTWQEDSTVCAEVRDTGSGIPAEARERIFEPFFTTKPIGLGSGLGLSIVRNIVTSLGGTIAVASEVGRGTSFVIRLPAVRPQPRTAEIPERPGEPAKRGRILVVDDEAGVRAALRRICAAHDVVESESGEQARALLKDDRRFDAILCDMMMPTLSGMDLHRWLISEDPELARRVVFVTGGAFTPDAASYLEHVDNRRIGKPFGARQVLDLVAALVCEVRDGRKR